MSLTETLTIHSNNIVKIEKLTQGILFPFEFLSPFTAMFLKWTPQHEKLLLRKHLQKFCSINNTALFDKSVNKTNASVKTSIIWQAFQTICLPFSGRYLQNIHIFHCCRRKTPAWPYLLWKYDKPQNVSVAMYLAAKRNRNTWMGYFKYLFIV